MSAGSPAGPAGSRSSRLDEVRALQHTLYRTAKADPGRRFRALRDRVFRRDVRWRGRVAVRANNGAPGIDKTTVDQIEGEYGALRLAGELAAGLREGRYRPLPARGVMIPEPGLKDDYRPLAISAVRDRIVQAGFLPCSSGFRPKRPAHDAIQVVIDEAWRGRRRVAGTDIASCFTAIPHEKLMQAIEERVAGQSVLKLVRQVLRAGVMQDGQVRREVTGAAQGGPISPLPCNVCLHRLDRERDVPEHGVLVRSADDLLVMGKSAQQAQAALARLRALPADLGLEPEEAKTAVTQLEEGGPGLDFLGFHHQMVRSRGWQAGRGTLFPARWPADKAMRHARDRIRELTARSRLLLPPEAVVQDISMFLRGWMAYFRYGHSVARFAKIRDYATLRLAIFAGKRHNRGRRFGLSAVACLSPGRCGLISMPGVVVPPRASKPWREKPHAAGERRR